MILPDTHAGFGRAHARALVHLVAAHDPVKEQYWESRIADEGIDPLLDAEETFQAVLASPELLLLLPLQLVSYILIRHYFLKNGIESRALADYAVSMVYHFRRGKRAYQVAAVDDEEYQYLVDIVEDLIEVEGRRQFLLRVHLGNYSLWLSGLFPDYIRSRVHQKGGPDLSYYESMGQTGFALAADDPFARRIGIDELYRNLAEEFVALRIGLNQFSDEHLTPEATSAHDRIIRQVVDQFNFQNPA